MKKDTEEEIFVGKKSGDKVYFESPVVQSIYDTIDYIRDEAVDILGELDANVDNLNIDEFGEIAVDHLSDFADDISQLKDEIIDSKNIEVVNEMKFALNRDTDYVRRAQRKRDRLYDDGEFIDSYKTNIRIIELCNKAIKVNSHNAEAYYLKALALIDFEQYDEAISQLIKSIALEDDVNSRLVLADAYKLNGDYIDAIVQYDAVLDYEDSYEAFLGKAICYFNLEEYKKSDEMFEKADSISSFDDESKKLWDDCKQHLS